jgi:hypothetical protein
VEKQKKKEERTLPTTICGARKLLFSFHFPFYEIRNQTVEDAGNFWSLLLLRIKE